MTVILAFSAKSFSQKYIDYDIFKDLYNNKKEHVYKEKLNLKSNNEIQFIAKGFYSFYKIFVSSQDESHCFFYPSCSDYAYLSVKKNGIFIGLISAFDRLSRCNISIKPQYKIQKNTGLYIDIP